MNDEQGKSYRVGVSRICITPELPCEMAGYFHSRIAESVARDLYAGVLVLEQAGSYAVMVSADLVAMTDEVCMPAFERASRKWGIPLSSFVASATHTHTGPEIRRGNHIPACEAYLQVVPELISQAVDEALSNLFDADPCVGTTQAPGLAHNRLSRCADGSEIFGRQSGGSKVIGAAGPEDDSVQTLSIYDSSRKLRAIVVNFACHPDLAGGGNAKAIDADWPGEMGEYLTRIHGPEVVCMLWQGTAGDINHADHRATTARWLPAGRSMVARGVAGAALYAMETATPLGAGAIACQQCELEVPYYVRDEQLWSLVESLRQKGDTATYFEQNLIKKVDNWTNDGKVDHLTLSCLRVGDLAIVALPGEIFTAWGLEIKRYSPARHTFIVELASSHDGMTAYKPTSDQALRGARGKGAYGALPTMSQRHAPAAGQMFADAAIAMLHELWAEADAVSSP